MATLGLPVNIQIIPEGFGSYLRGILPDDVATSAGAFGASMQQIKNITKTPIEKFAQVVANMETTNGLPLVNGTNVPTDVPEAQTALNLVALGNGPYNTYTYSDFFGCMSGLPYPWQELQNLIQNIQTTALETIYSDLYAATQGSSVGLDAAVQAKIDLANAEIAVIRTLHPGQSVQLNDLYEQTGSQLNIEQQSRNNGLARLPSPRDTNIYPYPVTIYSFLDTIAPKYAKETEPNMAALTLEAISDLDLVAGQSIVALMRSSRNQDRLLLVGIPLDDNIEDIVPYPAVVLPVVPPTGSLADPQQIIPPNLLISPASTYTVAQAIEQVITCNCDCWIK